MVYHIFRDCARGCGKNDKYIHHRGPPSASFPSSVGRLWVCFRSQPQKWGVSKCSVLSGGCQRGKTPRQKFLAKGFKQSGSSDKPLRAAASRQNGALRNITIFFPWLRKHTHSRPAEEGKARREAPGDGCICLYVVGCMKNR